MLRIFGPKWKEETGGRRKLRSSIIRILREIFRGSAGVSLCVVSQRNII
jgi:alkylation response protein AidB-like acyl-CoA dehydrogenase